MTRDCSLNPPKNTSSEHVVYKYCFECQNKNKKQFLYTTCRELVFFKLSTTFKSFGSDSDTKIGPWFRILIPNPFIHYHLDPLTPLTPLAPLAPWFWRPLLDSVFPFNCLAPSKALPEPAIDIIVMFLANVVWKEVAWKSFLMEPLIVVRTT